MCMCVSADPAGLCCMFPLQGANYIPPHIIHTNVTSEMLDDTLNYALESNMNM